MSKIILTGDRPTGRLHVGHYVGSLKRRVELQNSGEYDKIYIMIADAQALTDNADDPEKVRENIIEVALDYLACGIDPDKSTILIQSQIPELTELTFYYMNLVTVSRLQRNPTVKSEIKMRNFETSIPVGFFTYPISQAADITAFQATTVPAGEDQMPMLEQTKEIVHKFNSVYGEALTDPSILLPENEACLRLPGIDGKAKMSKSLGNCIYLSEEPNEIKNKIMSMYTDPDHIKITDPGKLEGNTVFTYLDAFSKPEHFERYLPEYAQNEMGKKMLATTSILLRGIPFIYQGQEIGMQNARWNSVDEFDDISTKDQYRVAREAGLSDAEALAVCSVMSRDNARTPMQWKDAPQAGFTSGTPWLKVNDNYPVINVEKEEEQPDSVLHYYRKLIALRKSGEYRELFTYGKFEPAYENADHVMAYYRILQGRRVLVAANFGTDTIELDWEVPAKKVLLSNKKRTNAENKLILEKCEVFVTECK